jgi:hypothetical protein
MKQTKEKFDIYYYLNGEWQFSETVILEETDYQDKSKKE